MGLLRYAYLLTLGFRPTRARTKVELQVGLDPELKSTANSVYTYKGDLELLEIQAALLSCLNEYERSGLGSLRSARV